MAGQTQQIWVIIESDFDRYHEWPWFGTISQFPHQRKKYLILTSLPGQFVDIHSPDKLSDHDIVSRTLKIAIPTHPTPL